MRRFERLGPALPFSVAAIIALAFAASFGFHFGFDNQVVYFLKSLTLTNDTLLRNDWFTRQTTQYHVLFAYFGALLLKLSARGWAVAVVQFVAVSAGGLLLYRLLRRVAGAAGALPAYMVLMGILFVTRTSSVGTSYLFDSILQPSTLGALGSIAGMVFFVEERWLASGLCLAAGGAFHANYLVLSYPVFGLAQLALGPKGLPRRLVLQFAPLVAATLLLSPLLLAASHTKSSPAAQEILFRIRSPHHYNPARYERNFMPFTAWQMLGIGSGWLVHRTPDGRRLGALLAGLMATIWAGTVLSAFFDVAKVTQIFVWRYAPNADLIGAIFVACALVRIVNRPRAVRGFAPAAAGLVVAGLGLFGLYFRNKDDAELPRLLFAFLALVLGACLLDWVLFSLRRRFPKRSADLGFLRRWLGQTPILIGVVVLYHVAPIRVARGVERSRLLHVDTGSQADLYRWLRERSPKDAIFLTPPDLEGARYLGQRAIVVDWKAVPLIPTELLGWYERLCDVTGRRVDNASDMSGYGSLDDDRLALITRKYHADFVVVRSGGEARLAGLPLAYRNAGYTVLRTAP